MTFTYLDFHPLPDIKTETVDGKRFYLTPAGRLPSVTTVLGYFDKEKIIRWRNRVGEEEANKVSSKATSRGNSFHSLAESYLKNKELDFSKTSKDNAEAFHKFMPVLNRINNIHHVEASLYSLKLGMAGRTDVIAEFDGIGSIIDHKTSVRAKKEAWIQHYFEQLAAYGIMYRDMTGITMKQIVILMHVDELPEPVVYVKDTSDYILSLKEKIRKYQEEN